MPAAALSLAISLGCLTSAQAATVEAREETSATAVNRVSIDFHAAAGEANDVTISAAPVAPGALMDVQIVDANAPLEAKATCSGGGAPGTPVHCVVHGPKWSDMEYCGHDCFRVVPGTEWRLALSIDLGDEANVLDAEGFPEISAPAIDMTVKGGPNRDEITTGSGNDRIDPGPGDDVVQAGNGYDTIVAGATFDGNDVYDLGPYLGGEVDYSARSEPLRFEAGVGGGAGERDRLSPSLIVGGLGNDTFVGGEGFNAFEGGGGNDTLIGNGERDVLYGNAGDDRLYGEAGEDRLVGGSGNDVLDGGSGNDMVMELAEGAAFGPEAKPSPPEEPGGADLALGGPGDDWMSLGAENDTAYGEEGDDTIVAGAGMDTVDGGPGNDELAGGAGFDRIVGGAGADHIFAGPQLPKKGFFVPYDIPGPGPDSVDCGSAEDTVAIDAKDRVENCEKVRLEDPIKTGEPIRDSREGTVLLPVHVASPGRVIVFGPGIFRASRIAQANQSGHPLALLPVRPRGATRAALRHSGRRRVEVTVRYLRRDGGVFTARRHPIVVKAR